MAYSKPQVTIDLDEYNELLLKKEMADTDATVAMTKKVISTIFNNINDLSKVVPALRQSGIELGFVNKGYTGNVYTPDDFFIRSLKQ